MFILPIPEPIFGKIAFSKTTKDISSRVKGVGVGMAGGEGGLQGRLIAEGEAWKTPKGSVNFCVYTPFRSFRWVH